MTHHSPVHWSTINNNMKGILITIDNNTWPANSAQPLQRLYFYIIVETRDGGPRRVRLLSQRSRTEGRKTRTGT